ncbi:MAG: insulinase family protein [Phycisphaerae bacterium]
MRRFYRNYYQPDNATLVVAGKFDVDKTLALINMHFGAIPRPTRVLENTYTQEPPQDGARLVTLKRVGDVASAGLVYHIPSGVHPDFPAVQILRGILTDRPSGRLYKALVKTGMAASVSGSAFAWAEPGVMQFMAEVRLDKDVRQALDEMKEVVETVAASGISSEEVERIKTQILKSIKLGMTDSGRIGVRLSEAVAQGDWRLFFIHRDRIKTVTVDDVRRVAGQYLVQSNRTAGLFLPTSEPARATIPDTPAVADIVKGYRGSEEIAAGEAFIATPENIEARVKRFTLGSGIKVALLPKETRGDAVRASFLFRYGTEESLNGHTTALALIPTLLMRGTTKHDHQQLRDEIDRLQSRIMVGSGGGRRGSGAGGGPGTVSASIESDRANIVDAIKLLGEIMREPAFALDQFETVTTQQLARREQRLSDPRSRGMNAMSRALNPWPVDSIHYIPTLEEGIERLQSVSHGAIRELYSKLYGAGNLSVAVVGDFDEDEIRATVTDVFGSWKSPSPYERVAQPRRPYKAEELTILTPDKKMATVGMAATFAMRDDDPEYPALAFANYILGQSAKSRLLNRLRHQGGLSYGAGSSFRAGSLDRRAALTGFAICAPQNAVEALSAMRDEVMRWIAEGVTSQELEDGKKSYALKFENSLANDRFVLGQLVNGLEIDRTFAFHAELLKRIQSLTAADIRGALKKHLGDARFVRMKAGDLNKKPEASEGGLSKTKEMPGPGGAPEAASGLPEHLARFDQNGDGKLQKTEAPERMQQFFDRLDANGDGAIDAEEANAMRARRRDRQNADNEPR